MKLIRRFTLAALLLPIAAPAAAQDVAPFFEQVPAVLYETYKGTTSNFNAYFDMLVAKYDASGGEYGWAIYRQGPKVAYRISVLPEGLESLAPMQRARGASFQEFDDDQMALWSSAWGTRHAAVYSAAPALSVVPEGFTVDDIRALPYHRTTIYHLKWDQAGAFRDALRRRAELDRAANIENFVFTVWNGGIGTEGQIVMIRVAAENEAADDGPNREARAAARQGYLEEFRELVRIMNDSSWHIERHDEYRVSDLSWAPSN